MKAKSTKAFSIISNIALPFYALALYLGQLKTTEGFLVFIFISLAIIERYWETYKTSKEKERETFAGDWTLYVLSIAYLLLFFVQITEFYFIVKKVDLAITVSGIILLGLSLRLRFWGMAALGKQWAVHAVGEQKIDQVRVIRIGPYKYIRHPIYLGIILEVISFPLILNALNAFLFSILCCVPLVILRASMEEKTSLKKLGVSYEKYRHEVGMFFPIQILIRNKPK